MECGKYALNFESDVEDTSDTDSETQSTSEHR